MSIEHTIATISGNRPFFSVPNTASFLACRFSRVSFLLCAFFDRVLFFFFSAITIISFEVAMLIFTNLELLRKTCGLPVQAQIAWSDGPQIQHWWNRGH
jgi:hypothetical protein